MRSNFYVPAETLKRNDAEGVKAHVLDTCAW
jgi:hypothetical protein